MNPIPTSLVGVLLAGLLAGCSAPNESSRSTTDSATTVPAATIESVSSSVIADMTALDPELPLPTAMVGAAPTALGPLFATGDAPLPAQTTGALADAGGEAMAVNDALSLFGIFGIPRPSGVNSAVMELRSTGGILPGGGSSLTVEVVYMVASSTPINDLLPQAADSGESGATVETVADYDGTVGDPRCARLAIASGPVASAWVEGCEYRADPLQEIRSIGFRRLNLPVTDPLVLPAIFASFPVELLDAGDVQAFTATFGRPTGPSGNTIQLEVHVQLEHEPTLPEIWQTDGPGRWWHDTATITIDGGQAVWRLSTRADQL